MVTRERRTIIQGREVKVEYDGVDISGLGRGHESAEQTYRRVIAEQKVPGESDEQVRDRLRQNPELLQRQAAQRQYASDIKHDVPIVHAGRVVGEGAREGRRVMRHLATPRWQAVRRREQLKIARRGVRSEAEQMGKGIALPIGIMLIIFAVLLDILDLFDAIPYIGTIITIMMSAGGIVLWILYWLAGARGLAKAVIMLLAYIAEMIPVIGLFPINTIVAVAVYLISQPWFLGAVVGAVGLAGATGRLGKGAIGALGGLAGGKKPAEEYA